MSEGQKTIRSMKHGEEDEIRRLLAELSFEDQTLWRKQSVPLEEYVRESRETSVDEEIKGKNVVLVAEEDGKIVALCWCSIVDRGIDKQAEIAEFYVEKGYRGKGIGRELVMAAKQLFTREKVEVAFVWTHRGNDAAIDLYKDAGFKEVDQVVMALVLSGKEEAQPPPTGGIIAKTSPSESLVSSPFSVVALCPFTRNCRKPLTSPV